jgi:hypothetical protein
MSKVITGITKRKFLFAILAAITVFGGVYGFAASLGTTTSGLGADNDVVAACGSGITVDYTTSYASGGYVVDHVNLGSIPAGCQGKAYKIQLTGNLPAAPATTANIATSGNPDAKSVQGVSLVVG